MRVTFCHLKLGHVKNSIVTNTWNSERMVDFCCNLAIDGWITNWYYHNRYKCDCNGHLRCSRVTLKILKCCIVWVIDTETKCIFLHVNIQVTIAICIFIVLIIFMVYYCIEQYVIHYFFHPKY